jgi:hypothetical protein
MGSTWVMSGGPVLLLIRNENNIESEGSVLMYASD